MPVPSSKPQAIVIGASAGAIGALSAILPALPPDYPLPIMIVVHIPPDTKSLLTELFAAKCRLPVKEAEDKETIRPGVIYFAAPNYHLLVELDGTLSLSSDEPELFSRPAINVLFESAAEAYGPELIGIILTGASDDGAQGLRLIHDDGGLAVIQAPQSAEISVMPQAALAACPAAQSIELNEIADLLMKLPNALAADAN